MHCQLTELLYHCLSSYSYPISGFLSTQPTIEKLIIVCPADGLSNLAPEALPALRDLNVPVQLLSTPLISHLSRLSRLFVLNTVTNLAQFVQLAGSLQTITVPRLLELLVGIDTSMDPRAIEIASIGLGYLGSAAPFVTSLKLNIDQGYIWQDELHDMFLFVLPRFPNLRTLTMMSPPPYEITYTRNFQMRKLSQSISPPHNALSSALTTDISLLLLALQSGSTQDQPNSDALHDKS
ncbi:hypothetical protein ACGC1H_001193 [Rhizoctonia solani]